MLFLSIFKPSKKIIDPFNPIGMALKTTTWKDRNIDNLELTLAYARKFNIKQPVVVNFGPGGSVSFLANKLPRGKTASLTPAEKFLRVFESFLRKSGLFSLKTNEPKEILQVFAELQPVELNVYDREKKVLTAVRRMARNKEIEIPLNTGLSNLQEGPVEAHGDIVVALNIIARTNDRSTTLQNILESVKEGGLICVNIDDAPEGFEKMGHCVFRRIS